MTVGASIGLGWGGSMVNVTSRNNILDVKRASFRNLSKDPLADYNYNLYRGPLATVVTNKDD